jgi:hypothetical protein
MFKNKFFTVCPFSRQFFQCPDVQTLNDFLPMLIFSTMPPTQETRRQRSKIKHGIETDENESE